MHSESCIVRHLGHDFTMWYTKLLKQSVWDGETDSKVVQLS